MWGRRRMRTNRNLVIEGNAVVLVPYRKEHVQVSPLTLRSVSLLTGLTIRLVVGCFGS